MNCAEARDWILEADPAELARTDDSALVGHLGTCEECRRVANRILVAQAALETSIASSLPRTSVEDALRAAEVRVQTERCPRAWKWVVPVAAAAGIAGLLLLSNRAPELPGEIWRPPPVSLSSGVDVEAPPGKDVAVFDLEDRPDIVVVWFFDQGDE